MGSRLVKLWPWATGLLVLATYIFTGARSYSWMNFGNDGADLAAAIATGGIPHPPGFPLYLLLGRAATWLLPLPDFMWRLNVLSAIGGALAVILISLAAYQLTRSRIAAAAGALTYGFALLPWGQATITEVSSWLAALSAGCLYSLTRARDDARWLVAAWLCCGLAAAVHPIGLVCVPTILWFMWTYKVFSRSRWGYLASMLAFLVPLALYFLPYIRSQGNSPYIWAEVKSLRQLWWYTSFHEYWGTANLGQASYYLRGAGKFLAQLVQNLGLLGSVVAAAGLATWRADRRSLKFLVGAILLFSLPVIIHNENPVVGGYYALSLLPVGLLVAMGARRFGWLAFAAPAALLLMNWSTVDAHNDTRFKQMIEQVANDVAPNALIITLSGKPNELDEVAFGLAYGFLVYEHRSDVKVVVNVSGPAEIPMLQQRLPQYDWSGLAEVGAAADNDPAAGDRIAQFVQANQHLGPIYFSFGNRGPADAVLSIGQLQLYALPHGLLYEVR